MGLFDRFTKSKKPVQETVSCSHPALSELAKIYDSIHISYEILEKDGTWKLLAKLQTLAGNRHIVEFSCDNINRNDITVTTLIKTPFSFEENIPDKLLILSNKLNIKYRYLQFRFIPNDNLLLRYGLPVCTANPGAAAREIAQLIMIVSDDIRNELKNYA